MTLQVDPQRIKDFGIEDIDDRDVLMDVLAEVVIAAHGVMVEHSIIYEVKILLDRLENNELY